MLRIFKVTDIIFKPVAAELKAFDEDFEWFLRPRRGMGKGFRPMFGSQGNAKLGDSSDSG